MDVYCRICGEPWDMECIHDEIKDRILQGAFDPLPDHANYQAGPQYQEYRAVYDSYYQQVRGEFYRSGCKAFWAFRGALAGDVPSWCVKSGTSGTVLAMNTLIDLMGDDLDGIASMMDDAQAMGLLD